MADIATFDSEHLTSIATDPNHIELDEACFSATEQNVEIAKKAWTDFEAGNIGTLH